MDQTGRAAGRRRNKAFDETHEVLIETAVKLVARSGIEAVSLSAVARAAGVNRTTVYYHFESREALITAIRIWSSAKLAAAFAPVAPAAERATYITRFVMENPEIMALWTEDFLAPGDIRERYTAWDGLVAGLGEVLAAHDATRDVDPEVFCVVLMTVALVGPRIYRNSVRPDLPLDEAVARFTREQMRMLERDGVS